MDLQKVFISLRKGAESLSTLNAQQKNAALESVKLSLQARQQRILIANAHDVMRAKEKGTKESLIDRLRLNEARFNSILEGIESVIRQPDPVGQIVAGWTANNGMNIRQVRVPFGVVSVIYESRPNVTVDVFALAYKSGNAVLLRGSSTALESNHEILLAIKDGLRNCDVKEARIPEAIELADSGTHEEVDEILSAVGKVDLVLPRGGASLIKHVVETSKIPVIETGSGICHAFVDESADLKTALNIVENAKLQRPGVCNAIECLVVHKNIAEKFLPMVVKQFDGKCEFRCDEASFETVNKENEAMQQKAIVQKATDEDFDTEFLDNILAIKIVDNVECAIQFINEHNTKHSETIISKDLQNLRLFQNKIDAACVYTNVSTRFTDGEVFGFGAEIGISTQKMHVRGPMGLTALTTTKYLIDGEGQIR